MEHYNDYLYHHGVKGMKWGHRKKEYSSSISNTKLKYKSNQTRSFEKASDRQSRKAQKFLKKANKARGKAKSYASDAKKSASIDKQMKNYYDKQSKGAKIAQSLLLNNLGKELYTYNKAVKNRGTAESVLRLLNNATVYSDSWNRAFNDTTKVKK